MAIQLGLILSVPLKVIATCYIMNLAADTAVKVVDDQWILKAHRLSRVIGMDGLVALFGSFGLFMAFLICSSGITAGFLYTSPDNTLLQPRALSGTIFTGFSVFAGCTIAGTFVYLLFFMLVTLELKGLLLIGFLLAAVLIMEYYIQPHYSTDSSARMLILFSVTFITMQSAVQTSYNMTVPSLVLLLPFVVLLGYSTDKIGFKKPRGYIILSFMITVVVTGVVLGCSIDEYYLRNPVLSEMASTLTSVVYKIVSLTGLVGALAGALVAYVWREQEANGLSLWICGPVAVILYNLDTDSHVSLHNFVREVLGPEGELGLITSFAAASGFSFGLALKYIHIMLRQEITFSVLVILGLFIHIFISSINLFVIATIVLCLGLLSTMDSHDKLVPLKEAAWDFAVLAKVMMGATILGLAILLTWPLGKFAILGLMLAMAVVIGKAWAISHENVNS